MEEILKGLAHASLCTSHQQSEALYLGEGILVSQRMNDPTELAEALLASTGQQLAQTIRARLLGSVYGRYYLVDGSADRFQGWDGTDEDQLEELVRSCREDGLISEQSAFRPPRGAEGTIWACQLAETLWPTDQGKLRLGLAFQASGRSTLALRCFDRVVKNAVVPSMALLAQVLTINCELHDKQYEAAANLAKRAVRLAPEASGVVVTSLLAGIQANDLPLIREAAYRLDELGPKAHTSLDLLTEKRARRIRDGLQDPPRRLPRRARAYMRENSLRVYHLNDHRHD